MDDLYNGNKCTHEIQGKSLLGNDAFTVAAFCKNIEYLKSMVLTKKYVYGIYSNGAYWENQHYDINIAMFLYNQGVTIAVDMVTGPFQKYKTDPKYRNFLWKLQYNENNINPIRNLEYFLDLSELIDVPAEFAMNIAYNNPTDSNISYILTKYKMDLYPLLVRKPTPLLIHEYCMTYIDRFSYLCYRIYTGSYITIPELNADQYSILINIALFANNFNVLNKLPDIIPEHMVLNVDFDLVSSENDFIKLIIDCPRFWDLKMAIKSWTLFLKYPSVLMHLISNRVIRLNSIRSINSYDTSVISIPAFLLAIPILWDLIPDYYLIELSILLGRECYDSLIKFGNKKITVNWDYFTGTGLSNFFKHIKSVDTLVLLREFLQFIGCPNYIIMSAMLRADVKIEYYDIFNSVMTKNNLILLLSKDIPTIRHILGLCKIDPLPILKTII
jgi:hypothetical protein